jgi:hypothetical protein
MKWMGTNGRAGHVDLLSLASWVVFLVIFGNLFAFVMCCANPVLMADDWYFLDVFVRKAIDGSPHFADFFVKRVSGDHSEPFIKMVLLWCLREFNLDISFEAVIGVLVALGCVLLFRALIFQEGKSEAGWARHLAWVAICAIIFSLNGVEIWAWPLNSAQYSSFIFMPVFMWSVWRAYCRNEYLLLAGVTFLLAFISDDNAVICIAATLGTLTFYALLGKVAEKVRLVRIFAVVLAITLIVRVGYLYAPLVGGTKAVPLADRLHSLYSQIKAGQWSKWIETPMIWSIASRSFLPASREGLFRAFEYGSLGLMLFLQCWFWLRAIRHDWNLLVFVSICLMLVTYGWMAGVLLYRVPEYGADYFKQDRYVRLYQFDLVALVLMWVGSVLGGRSHAGEKKWLNGSGAIACFAILALQIPLSVTAWAMVPYKQRYYQDLARQIYQLASNPSDAQVLENCNPQFALCGYPLERREDVLQLIRDNHLNIFSPRVVLAHPYLLNATFSLSPTYRARLLSAASEVESRRSAESVYGSVRSLFSAASTRWPMSGIDVNVLPSNYVPLMLGGCWDPDGARHRASSWCGPNVSLVLQKPASGSNLVIQGMLPWDLYAKAGQVSSVTLTVTVNDVPVARKTSSTDGLFTINVPAEDLPASEFQSGLMYIRISADSSFVQSRFLPSQDSRELSMKLSSIYFSSPVKGVQ